MKRMNFPARKTQRRNEAIERQTTYVAKLKLGEITSYNEETLEEQIDVSTTLLESMIAAQKA